MDASDPTHPNDRLRQERIRRNWRQNEIADKIGTTVVTVNRWERGNQQPSAYFRVKLCALFEKSAEELGLLSTKNEPIDGEAQQIIYSSEQVHTANVPSQQVSTPQNQNRIHMLRRLYRSYSDLLTQSLQGAVWIELGLSQKPDVVQNAANLLLHTSNGRERPFPPGTSILEVYDEAEHELLILGAPGAGKSTLLLDLAQRLLTRAEQDDTHPLPIILPLSLWAVKKSSLQDWACEQLIEIYDVPRRVSEQWMQEEKILLLLDGLDEMEASARQACIAAINTYHHNHLVPLVVCSRTTEYDLAAGHHRLALQRAVIVQPLTALQVDAYLDTLGKSQIALRYALQGNPTLQEMATTPLMLNVLLLTYQDASVPALSEERDQVQQNIWTDYVQRMVTRKGDTKYYPPQKTCSWLGWLAHQMRERNMTVLYLEHLQPDWLQARQQKVYVGLAVLLPGILIGILASLLVRLFFGISDAMPLFQQSILGGLLGGILSNSARNCSIQYQPSSRSPSLILRGLALNVSLSVFIGTIYGLSDRFSYLGYSSQQGYISGPIIGLCCLLLLCLLPSSHSQQNYQKNNRVVWPWQFLFRLMGTLHGRRVFMAAAILGGGIALSNGLLFGLQMGRGFKMIMGLSVGLNLGLTGALSFGLTSILISLILTTQGEGIQLAERLRWSWRSLLKSLLMSKHCRTTILLTISIILIDGLAFGLSNGLVAGLISGVSTGLPIGVTGGLNIGLMLGLIGGLSNGLSTGLSFGLSYWLLFGLVQGISSERVDDQDRREPNQGIRRSIRNGLLLGMISGTLIGFIGWLGFVLNAWLSPAIVTWLISGLVNKPLGNLNAGLNNIELGFILNIGWLMVAYGGLLACAINGGLAAWRHAVLRLLLWQTHTLPCKASRFLNDATARILLRRVGGGYSFMHRMLLDYFADQDTKVPSATISIPTLISSQDTSKNRVTPINN